MLRAIALATLALSSAAGAAAPATAEESGLENTADMLLVGIPAVALGLTFFLPDDPASAAGWRRGFDLVNMTGAPRHDLALAMLRTTTFTYGFKYTVDEERPNGKDRSFPSAHTSYTFASAEFIRKEYGWGWGLPAYLAAGYVGWSRVATDDHWWHDVAAGAAIGMLSNHDLGDFSTRWGGVKLRPALLNGAVDHQFDNDWAPAPGMKLELRF